MWVTGLFPLPFSFSFLARLSGGRDKWVFFELTCVFSIEAWYVENEVHVCTLFKPDVRIVLYIGQTDRVKLHFYY